MNIQKSPCILVVDDQDNWRDALTDILSEEGYCVKTAALFDDAIQELKSTKFAVVVLDVRLIDDEIFNVSGVELLKIIKSQPDAPKVIMLTGHPESIRDGVLELYGADDLILKVPKNSSFDPSYFIEKIHNLI